MPLSIETKLMRLRKFRYNEKFPLMLNVENFLLSVIPLKLESKTRY